MQTRGGTPRKFANKFHGVVEFLVSSPSPSSSTAESPEAPAGDGSDDRPCEFDDVDMAFAQLLAAATRRFRLRRLQMATGLVSAGATILNINAIPPSRNARQQRFYIICLWRRLQVILGVSVTGGKSD
jgi:hypothetical protein